MFPVDEILIMRTGNCVVTPAHESKENKRSTKNVIFKKTGQKKVFVMRQLNGKIVNVFGMARKLKSFSQRGIS